MTGWWIYMLRCADGSLYTGITRDLDRRVDEHNAGGAAASRYTRTRRPVQLVYSESAADRAAAARRESEIKALTRPQKERLLADARPSS